VLTGGGIIASANALLGRRWDARHLQAWRGLVADSLYGRRGRARVAARWSTQEKLLGDRRSGRRAGATSQQ
jgi:hypothetical protein